MRYGPRVSSTLLSISFCQNVSPAVSACGTSAEVHTLVLLNALLASLNPREELRQQLEDDILSIPLSPRNVAHNGSDSGRDTIGANPDSGKQMNSYRFQL